MQKTYLNTAVKTPLPYSLNSLKVQNFQGIIDLEVSDLPCDAQWIFLVGENGFGKTSVLRAIANTSFLDSFHSIYEYQSPDPNDFLDERWSILENLPILGYGISRFNLSHNLPSSNDATASLFKDDAILENIEQEMKEWHNDPTDNRCYTIRKLLCDLLPNIADISIRENTMKKKEVFYFERAVDGIYEKPLTLTKLATGYKNIIMMIGDMLIRLRRWQHESVNLDNYQDYEGVILIDEFDAHLHPKYQYELPKLLSSVFPKVQFIVSTHSPIPLLGAPKNNTIVMNVNRTIEKGITMERSTVDFTALNANAILTSPIFGFDETHFNADKDADSIAPFDDYSEVETQNRIAQNIQKLRELNVIK